jgi:hypothetical protein
MRMILHMADIGNVAKPTSLAIPWAKGVSQGELVRTGTVVWLSAHVPQRGYTPQKRCIPQTQHCYLH